MNGSSSPEDALPLPAAAPTPDRCPGPRGRRLLGSLLEIRADRIQFVRHAREQYGDAVAFRMGTRSLYLFSHPDAFRQVLAAPNRYVKGPGLVEARPLLGDGLLTADDRSAASMRKILGGAFGAEALRSYAPAMVDAAERARCRWAEEESVDIVREMVTLTLDVLGRTVLGTDLTGRAVDLARDVHHLAEWSMARMTAIVPLPLGLSPAPRAVRARRALRRLERWARLVQGEPVQGEPVQGQPVHGQPVHSGSTQAGSATPGSILGRLRASEIEPRQQRDELLTFLLAGHETTAAALAWSLWLLGTHPEVEAGLHDELDAVLGAGGASRPPTVDDLPRLPFLRAVFDETLRLYPPVWLVPRRALAEERILGHRVPAGSDVLLCVYTLQRHPDLWPEPDTFRPERFLSAARPAVSGSYLPFGLGPRSCLGGRFATQEALLVLATLARRLRLVPTPGARAIPEPSLTLRPRFGIPMRPVSRG